jgi:hypothetical protein
MDSTTLADSSLYLHCRPQMKLARPACFLLTSSTVALAANVQAPILILPPSAAQHKAAVVDIFNRSYSAYK